MADLAHDEAAAVGPRCGNNPNVRLSPGDQQAVDEFTAYLARRRAGGAPERDPFSDAVPEAYCSGDECADCAPNDECCETVCGVCPRVSAHDGCTMTRGEMSDTRSCRQHGLYDIVRGV